MPFDSKIIAMCTACRHLVQRKLMNMGWYQGRNILLCPNCYAENDPGIPNPAKEDSDKLDPEMLKLQERLKKKGLM